MRSSEDIPVTAVSSTAPKKVGGGCRCCVPECKHRSIVHKGVSWHYFPKKSSAREQWIQALIQDTALPEVWRPKKTYRLCGAHFSPSGKRQYMDKVPRFLKPGTYMQAAPADKPMVESIPSTPIDDYSLDIIVPSPVEHHLEVEEPIEQLTGSSVPVHIKQEPPDTPSSASLETRTEKHIEELTDSNVPIHIKQEPHDSPSSASLETGTEKHIGGAETKKRKGGTLCCVVGCRNNMAFDRHVSWHKFPKDPATRAIWTTRVNRRVPGTPSLLWQPTEHSRICGAHFNVTGKRAYMDKLPKIFPGRTVSDSPSENHPRLEITYAPPPDAEYILPTEQHDGERLSSGPVSKGQGMPLAPAPATACIGAMFNDGVSHIKEEVPVSCDAVSSSDSSLEVQLNAITTMGRPPIKAVQEPGDEALLQEQEVLRGTAKGIVAVSDSLHIKEETEVHSKLTALTDSNLKYHPKHDCSTGSLNYNVMSRVNKVPTHANA